jgi:hypothetical protein
MQTLPLRRETLTCLRPAQDPFLKYQVGAPYEALRKFNGRLFGAAGRTISSLLEWWNSKVRLPEALLLLDARRVAGADRRQPCCRLAIRLLWGPAMARQASPRSEAGIRLAHSACCQPYPVQSRTLL